MTFDTLKKQVGRKPYQFFELDLDFCPLRYGEGICNAKLSTVPLSNLFVRSEELDNASWTRTGLSGVTANANVNIIDFANTADRIVTDASTGRHAISQDVTFSAGQDVPHVVSVYIRPEDFQWFYMEVNSDIGFFDLNNGVRGFFSNTVTIALDKLEFNYFKCSLIFTPQVGTSTFTFGVANANQGDSFTSVNGSTSLFFGAQLRPQSDGNEYISTTTVAIQDQIAAGENAQKCFNTRKTCQDPDNYMGKGIEFDGSDDRATVSNVSTLEVSTNEITLECYVFPNNNGNGPLITYSTPGNLGPGMSVTGTGTRLTANLDGTAVFSDFDVFTKDRWAHCVATYSNSTATLYVDGRVVGSATVGATLRATASLDLHVGHNNSSGNAHYDSRIAHARVYNRALSQLEIRKRIQDNSLINAGLLVNLTLSGGANTTLLDSSSFNHDATFVGASSPNYVDGPVLTKTYRLGQEQGLIPVELNSIPCIERVGLRPSIITPGSGIGSRSRVEVTARDFPHHDRLIDKYVDERNYQPLQQGTYFGKLLRRNPFAEGRHLRLLTGYLNDYKSFLVNGGNIESLFQQRSFIIENFDGPDSLGKVRIVAKDPLKFIDDNRATAPVQSNGRLLTSAALGATSLVLQPGDGAEYPDSGTVRVNQEIMTYSSKTGGGDNLSGLSRAQFGTQEAEHNIDDAVQLCVVYNDVNVVDIVFDLLVNQAGIPPSFIPFDEWDAEKTQKLSTYLLTAVLSTPIGVKTLIEELAVQTLLNIYWDETAGLIRLRSLIPDLGEVFVKLNDRQHILRDSVQVRKAPQDRISRFIIKYGIRNYSEEPGDDNVQFAFVSADLSAESKEQYGSARNETILSRWFDVSNRSQAIQTASRLLSRFRDIPELVKFRIDAKDADLSIGQIIELEIDQLQDDTGAQVNKLVQIISIRELTDNGITGSIYEIDTQDILLEGTTGAGGFGKIAPDSQVDFASASDSEKQTFFFIANSIGEMSDGSPGYKIL